jgi:type I restriction enzyme R subunit
MAFFAQKVRRLVPGNFTFVIMTDREDLDEQIYRTFVGCGIADEATPRAASGKTLKALLQENNRFIFSLVHKFNQDVKPGEPYSQRDDIIVISDEAHRTQSGKLARNMRLALPNAAFIGFTGTPLFKHDHLTRRIFGSYVSRYDFKRSEQDQSTVKLIYENRGEKLGIARLDLNDRIAEKVEEADLDPDEMALLEKLLGKDYEVITADDRLDKLADDFVEHCTARWESGKSMLVCIDKVTCARMYQRIMPRWQARLGELRAQVPVAEAQAAAAAGTVVGEKRAADLQKLLGRIRWMELTERELALYDLLRRENLTKADRERLKQASRSLLARLQQLLAPMGHWTRNAQTQAEVQASILDWLFETLPRPPFTDTDTEDLANRVYEYVWQQSEAGQFAA